MTDPSADPVRPEAVRTLTVRGHGRASLPADEADVTLGVEVVRPTAGSARDAAAEAMNRVLANLGAQGIADADIRTTDLALSPEVEYRPDGTSRRIGFRLSNRLTVRVHDPAAIPAIVDGAVEAGATSLDGVSFRARDSGSAREAALAAAVLDARAGAGAMAGGAGVRLGAVRAIREADAHGGVPEPRMAMMEAKAADTPVLPGTTEISAAVEVTWDLDTDAGSDSR